MGLASTPPKPVSFSRSVTGRDLRDSESRRLANQGPEARSKILEEIKARRAEAAASRDGKALLALGRELEKMRDVPGAKQLAREVVEQAADFGSLEAKVRAGDYARQGIGQKPNFKKALEYYDAAGNAGDSDGYAAAARMLIEGKIAPADLDLARVYIEKALALGSNEALFLKGSLLLDQPAQSAEAMSYLVKAAQAGNPDAQLLLGRLYRAGKYVPENPAQAVFWVKEATKSDSTAASVEYANLTMRGATPTNESQGAAIDRLFTAAENNDGRAALELAMMYRALKGATGDDLTEARRYAQIAFENGEYSAAFVAATTFDLQDSRDSARAMDWLKRGARAADWRSRYAYGLINSAGMSVQEAIRTAASADFNEFTDFTLAKNAAANPAVTPPQVISTPMPKFPPGLSALSLAGQVTARFLVNEEGHPVNIQVANAAHPQLAQAVVDAISTWKFRPAERDHQAVPMNIQVPIKFSSRP